MLPPSRFSTNDVQIMVNALYVLGIKHLSCRNDRCVIVREGQFLDLKQCIIYFTSSLFLIQRNIAMDISVCLENIKCIRKYCYALEI